MKTEEYLRILTEQIRYEKAKDAVREELADHIRDQKEAFLQEGMAEEEAEERAVAQMGDPAEAGIALDGIHRPDMAWGLMALTAALGIAGFAIQFMLQTALPGEMLFSGAGRYLAHLLLSFGVMIGVCRLDYTRIAYWAKEITAILAILLVLGTMVFGMAVNGAAAWISFAGVSVNIRLAALLFVPLYAAVLYSYHGEGAAAVCKGILWMVPALAAAGQSASIVTELTVFLSMFLLLMAAVYQNWFRIPKKPALGAGALFLLLLPAAGCLRFWFFGAPYQRERLEALLHPETVAGGAGYQVLQIRHLLEGSRLLGGNPDMLQEKYLIPVGQSYVLTYLTAYFGILAALLFMGMILFLFCRLLKLSLRQKNQLGMLMGAGCCIVFFLQILFYLAGNLGILPVDAYCPFLMQGGSGMLVTHTMLGLLFSIYRYRSVVPVKSPVRRFSLRD